MGKDPDYVHFVSKFHADAIIIMDRKAMARLFDMDGVLKFLAFYKV